MSKSAAKTIPQATTEGLLTTGPQPEKRVISKQDKRKLREDENTQMASDADTPQGGDVVIAAASAASDAPMVLAQASTTTVETSNAGASAAAAPAVGSWVMGLAALGGLAWAANHNKSSTATPTATTSSISGTAIDGYLLGAKVYLIAPDGTKIDTGVTTSAEPGKEGQFTIQNPDNYVIQIEGGTNADTGLENTVVLRAPATTDGTIVVTPLTTLIQSMVAQNGLSAADAEAAVRTKLGITGDVDLLTLDPIATENVGVQKANIQIATALSLVTDPQEASAVMTSLAAAIVNAVNAVNLSNAITASLAEGSTLTEAQIDAIGGNLVAIGAAESILELGASQKSILTNATPTLTVPLSEAEVIYTVGENLQLLGLSVADRDDDQLTLSLMATNGTIGGLADADETAEGIQLKGTATDINVALKEATFTAIASGAASIEFGVSDGKSQTVQASYGVTAVNPPFIATFDLESQSMSFSGDMGEPIVVSLNRDGSLVFSTQGQTSDTTLSPVQNNEFTGLSIFLKDGQILQVTENIYENVWELNIAGTGAVDFKDFGVGNFSDVLSGLQAVSGRSVLASSEIIPNGNILDNIKYLERDYDSTENNFNSFDVAEVTFKINDDPSSVGQVSIAEFNIIKLAKNKDDFIINNIYDSIYNFKNDFVQDGFRSFDVNNFDYIVRSSAGDVVNANELGLMPVVYSDFNNFIQGEYLGAPQELRNLYWGMEGNLSNTYVAKLIVTGDSTKTDDLYGSNNSALIGDLKATSVYVGALLEGQTGPVYIQFVPMDGNFEDGTQENGIDPSSGSYFGSKLGYRFITEAEYNSSTVVQLGVAPIVDGASAIRVDQLSLDEGDYSFQSIGKLFDDAKISNKFEYEISEYDLTKIFVSDVDGFLTAEFKDGVADIISGAKGLQISTLSLAQKEVIDNLQAVYLNDFNVSVVEVGNGEKLAANDLSLDAVERGSDQYLSQTIHAENTGDSSAANSSSVASGAYSSAKIENYVYSDSGSASLGDLAITSLGYDSRAGIYAEVNADGGILQGNSTIGAISLNSIGVNSKSDLELYANANNGDVGIASIGMNSADSGFSSGYIEIYGARADTGSAIVDSVNLNVAASSVFDSDEELSFEAYIYGEAKANIKELNINVGTNSAANVDVTLATNGNADAIGAAGIDKLSIHVDSGGSLRFYLAEDWTNNSVVLDAASFSGDGDIYITLGGSSDTDELTSFDFSLTDVSQFNGQLTVVASDWAHQINSLLATDHSEIIDLSNISNDLRIMGGAGDDVITGGAGLDTLSGDFGADTFKFYAGASGTTSGTADIIFDLSSGDRIDLSLISSSFTMVESESAMTDGFDAWMTMEDDLNYLAYETNEDGSAFETVQIGHTTWSNLQFQSGILTIA